MKFAWTLAIKNFKRRPGRTAAMILLAGLLSFSVFGGSLAVFSLRRGLKSYQSRLGADVVAVPNQATSHGTLESILLQGIPGYFYMDAACLEKIRGMDGVKAATPQFFLASAKAGCCSAPVQIIGFDPETDFSIQPWICEKLADGVGDGDVIVGSGLSTPIGRTLRFYETECRVAARLEQTGTGLDNAVYANMNTIKMMLGNAEKLGFQYLNGMDADRTVSAVMIKVKDGYGVGNVTDDINIHVRKVKATPTRDMIFSLADGLQGASRIVIILAAAVWILAAGILAAAFVLLAHERKQEFAALLILGASRKILSRLILTESMILSLTGAVGGAVLAGLVIMPFSGLIRNQLDLPYLMPGMNITAALFAGAAFLSALTGAGASILSVRRILKDETGLLLREEM